MSTPMNDASMVTEDIRGAGVPEPIHYLAAKLIVLDGPDVGAEFVLEDGETILGTATECQVQIIDRSISRRHLSINSCAEGYLLKDLASTNGSAVNGVSVKEAFLHSGATIKAGERLLRFDLVHRGMDVEPNPEGQLGSLIGQSEGMRRIFAAIEKVAPSNATVLVQGESGTGKGAVARAIHQLSDRCEKPLIVFDCAAVSPTLIESELFGHEKGAFTGAVSKRLGALEAAQGGTLFIDELTELPLDLQPRLLRALEEREFSLVGSHQLLKLDCRVIAASQLDVREEVQAGRFRKDLYFRLAVVNIPLPSLRARQEDIPLIAGRFLEEYLGPGNDFGALAPDDQNKILEHTWPGNIRELRNAVERYTVLHAFHFDETAPQVDAKKTEHIGGQVIRFNINSSFRDAKEQVVHEFERQFLEELFAQVGDNIAKAARTAGMNRRYLYTLMAKHGLDNSDS